VTPEQNHAHIVDQLGDIKELASQIAEHTLTREDMSRAVSDGLLRAMRDPQFWPALTSGMQGYAQNEAGGWLFGSLKAALSKVFLFFVLGLLIYMVGGWSGLVAFFKGGAGP